MREDHDGRAALQPLDVLLQPRELLVPERTEPAGLEIHDIDQADEVDAVLIEAVPARALRALAEPLQIAPGRRPRDVVFARGRRRPAPTARTALLQRVEFRWLREVREISGVKYERRRLGRGLIFAIASRRVAVTSVLAGLSNPIWLSLIWTKRSPPPPCDIIGACDVCPSGDPFRTPPDSPHTAPVPTHAMHCRKFRRPGSFTSFGATLTPSWNIRRFGCPLCLKDPARGTQLFPGIKPQIRES